MAFKRNRFPLTYYGFLVKINAERIFFALLLAQLGRVHQMTPPIASDCFRYKDNMVPTLYSLRIYINSIFYSGLFF